MTREVITCFQEPQSKQSQLRERCTVEIKQSERPLLRGEERQLAFFLVLLCIGQVSFKEHALLLL